MTPRGEFHLSIRMPPCAATSLSLSRLKGGKKVTLIPNYCLPPAPPPPFFVWAPFSTFFSVRSSHTHTLALVPVFLFFLILLYNIRGMGCLNKTGRLDLSHIFGMKEIMSTIYSYTSKHQQKSLWEELGLNSLKLHSRFHVSQLCESSWNTQAGTGHIWGQSMPSLDSLSWETERGEICRQITE